MLDIKKLEITDKNLIKKYLSNFNNFYIPANEHDTFDKEILDNDIFHKSSKIIGQHRPIEVAINESDPFNESSPYHIHLRIIDGRHRWHQAVKHDKIWITKFYKISDYSQYMQLRGHFDSKKVKTSREQEEFFENLTKYYELEKKIPLNRISTEITKDYSPPFSPSTIRRYIPSRFKDGGKVKASIASARTRHVDSIADLQKKSPNVIRSDYSRFKRELQEKDDENEFLRAEIGKCAIDRTFFVLEELNGKFWDFVHCKTDEKEAMDELKILNFARYRLRKVTHVNEIIYAPTTDPMILRQRRESESKRHAYQSKKSGLVNK